MTDTIKSLEDGQLHTLRRDGLYAAQTPQAFLGCIIKRAHTVALFTDFEGPDDASLVENMGLHVKIIPGDPRNIKVTTRADFDFVKYLIEQAGVDAYDDF